jgi:serine/threonine-protein phosphatase 2A regulatory subunit B''
MEDPINYSSYSTLSNFSSAKIKLEELFQTFLENEGHEKILNLYLEASRYPLDENLIKLDPDRASSNPGGISKSSLYKKSPKKRTQAEMAQGSSSNVAAAPSSSTPLDEMSRLTLSTATGAKNASSNVSSASAAVASTSSSSAGVLSSDSAARVSNDDDSSSDHYVMRRKTTFDRIPVFYVPGRKSPHISHVSEDDKLVKRLPEIEAFFKPFPGGIPVEKFVHVTKRLCGIPSFFNLPLCRRINERYGDPDAGIPAPRTVGKAGRQPSGVKIKLKTFLKFWQQEIEPYDRIERFFRIIKKHDAEYIVKDDFVPFLQELLHFHPGLDFLEAHEEFQRKYALTVITRIFYRVNTSRTGKISLREVRKSNLFNACMHVDEETDINKVLDYFSYEHFYVIYCKFFELDTDKDSKLTKHDLLKYGEHALSEAIVDRIFQVGTRVFSDGQIGGFDNPNSSSSNNGQLLSPGSTSSLSSSGPLNTTYGMSYPDFIFFMLSEEDKTSECALSYWFKCCDLDDDGNLSPEEMRFFYRNQIHRITALGQESINFEDVLCQMLDMVSPQNTSRITLADLVRPDKRMISGVLFDVLFNLHKFLRFESRDPFQEKIRREDIFHSDWDRFAHAEYNRLAQEEEDDNDNSSAGGYDAAMEVDSLLQQQQLQQSAPSLSQDGGSLAQSSDEEDEDDDEDDHGHRVGDQRHHGRGGGHQRSNSGDNWSMINDEESDEDEDEDALLGNRLVQRGRR